MGGYGFRKGKSIGVHDKLYAYAVYGKKDDKEFAMVSLDLLGLFNKHVNKFRKIINKKTGIPQKNILIHCVHNHSGPDTVGLTDIKGFFIRTINEDYFKPIEKGILNAIIKAKENAVPSKVGADKTETEKRLIVNRREPLKDSKYKIGVVRIDDLDGIMRGLIINYACHGTVLPSDNNYITADYIGYIHKTISKISKNKVFSIYFNGTCGDLNPNLFDFNIKLEDIDKSKLYDSPKGAKGSFKRAYEIGSSIAKTAWELSKKIQTNPIEKIDVISKDIYIPIKNILLKHDFKSLLSYTLSILRLKLLLSLRKISNLSYYNFIKINNEWKLKTEIQLFQINDILFPTLPGEFFLNLGEKILANSPTDKTFLVELANDCAGYFFSLDDFLEGGYEPSMSVSPLGGTYVVNKIIKLLRNVNI